MKYDVFIVSGSAFDMDSDFIKLYGLTWQESLAIAKLAVRQEGLDFVIRSAEPVEGGA